MKATRSAAANFFLFQGFTARLRGLEPSAQQPAHLVHQLGPMLKAAGSHQPPFVRKTPVQSQLREAHIGVQQPAGISRQGSGIIASP